MQSSAKECMLLIKHVPFFLPHVFCYILLPVMTFLAIKCIQYKSSYEKYSVYHLTEQ
ncbi:hypothetical protein BCV72DRAFT_59418 [Rhizopus microsporus var. microsporus]|uniref:Uncharacterized protein n=2 Tax=Rhizopus microsporus TaxID=58291 RepID=A0A2G4SKA9_RHIZD|nr:uncharacterized protein RHIMIDRAFT_49316 [Rhizopus microsporus ATCC 52813]ORE02096.1 hypothetical protein BCV72DRAFT_59418 [Rhizopus microsporus var. microsporus]PHZ09203.1 hypothetical protein RHIMIDRAFT_49316 [Rhizopus microsporus ATCC 52813]